MKYALIVDSLIVQVQPNSQYGFVEVVDDVVCGMTQNSNGVIGIIPLTADELTAKAQALAITRVQNMINKEATLLGFENIDSIAKYIGFANTFEDAAISLRNWVPLVWDYVSKVHADIKDGTRTAPTLDELFSELPERQSTKGIL